MLLVKCSSTRHGSLCLDLLYALGVIPWIFTVRKVDEGLLEDCRGLGLVSVGLFGGVGGLESGFEFACGLLAGADLLRLGSSFLLSPLFPFLFLPLVCLLLSPLKKTDLLY